MRAHPLSSASRAGPLASSRQLRSSRIVASSDWRRTRSPRGGNARTLKRFDEVLIVDEQKARVEIVSQTPRLRPQTRVLKVCLQGECASSSRLASRLAFAVWRHYLVVCSRNHHSRSCATPAREPHLRLMIFVAAAGIVATTTVVVSLAVAAQASALFGPTQKAPVASAQAAPEAEQPSPEVDTERRDVTTCSVDDLLTMYQAH